MNKKSNSLCLLVCALLTIASAQEWDMAKTIEMPKENHATSHMTVETPHVTAWYDFITNWMNNQAFFGMRLLYDLFCFGVGYTYVFWFNDGGYNFYRCYKSVPRNIRYL